MFVALSTWLAGKFGGAFGKLAELIVALVLLLALVGGPYWLGWSHRGETDAAAAAQERAKAVQAQAQALAAAQARAYELSRQLAEEQSKAHVEYRTLREEVPHVVVRNQYVPGKAQALVYCPFSDGFIRVWNRALDPAAGVPAAAGEPADAAAGADPAAAPSDVDQQDVLDNHLDNAEQCSDIRQQLNALIGWEQGNGGTDAH